MVAAQDLHYRHNTSASSYWSYNQEQPVFHWYFPTLDRLQAAWNKEIRRDGVDEGREECQLGEMEWGWLSKSSSRHIWPAGYNYTSKKCGTTLKCHSHLRSLTYSCLMSNLRQSDCFNALCLKVTTIEQRACGHLNCSINSKCYTIDRKPVTATSSLSGTVAKE